MKKSNKKPIRRDGFRGQRDFLVGGSYPFTFRPTEKDAQKRITKKQLIPKKK